MIRKLFIPFLFLPALVFAQSEQKKDVWEPLRFLEGTWEGEEPGVSKVTQVYEFVLKGNFLHMKTRSVFEPTEKNPKGELDAVVHAGLCVDVGDVIFGSLYRYIQPFADIFVAQSFYEQGDNFFFPVGNFELGEKPFQSLHGNWNRFDFESVFLEKMVQVQERGDVYRRIQSRKKEVMQHDIPIKGKHQDMGKQSL